jgi:hypothetical protein
MHTACINPVVFMLRTAATAKPGRQPQFRQQLLVCLPEQLQQVC